MQNEAYGQEAGSGSGSGYSDLSALENDTDTLGRAIIKHERDARRIQAVLHGSLRPFSSRGLPRASVSQRFARPSKSAVVAEATEAHNVEEQTSDGTARQWGRKDRPLRNWTRRDVLARDGTHARAPERILQVAGDDDAIVPHRTAYTGDIYVAGKAAAFQNEDTPPSMKRERRQASPSTLRHMNSTVVDAEPGLSDRSQTSPLKDYRPPSAPSISRFQSRLAKQERLLQEGIDEDKENVLHGAATKTKETHSRSDSIQLLRRLARVSSMSPQSAQDRSKTQTGLPSTFDTSTPIHQSHHSTALDTPVITGGWIDTPKQEAKMAYALGDSVQSGTEHKPDEQIVLPDTQQNKPGAIDMINDNLTRHTRLPPPPLQPDVASEDRELAKHIERVTASDMSRPASNIPPSSRRHLASRLPKRVTFDLNACTVCEHCGGGYRNIWTALWIELRSNFYARDPDAFATIRLTWLGAAVVTWLCWYILESLLCNVFCKPDFAYDMLDYGAQPSAPRYPLVLPTLLLRPFDVLWRPVLTWLLWLVRVSFNWIYGEGAADYTLPVQLAERTYLPKASADKTLQPASWTRTGSTLAAASSRRVIASAVDAIDDMGRAWHGDAFA